MLNDKRTGKGAAFFLLFLLLSVQAFSQGKITGVVLKSEPKDDVRHALALSVEGTEDAQVDRIRLNLGYEWNKGIKLSSLPGGWGLDEDRSNGLVFSGSSLGLPLNILLEGDQKTGDHAELEIEHRGERLFFDSMLPVQFGSGYTTVPDANGSLDGRLSFVPNFSWRLHFLNIDDFETSVETFGNQAKEFTNFDVMTGSFSNLSRARFGLDARYQLNDNIGLNAGIGFLCGCERLFEQSWQYRVDPRYKNLDEIKFGLRTFDVRFGLDLKPPCDSPLAEKTTLRADAGVDFHSLTLGYNYESRGPDYLYYDRGDLKGSTVGFSFSLGADYELFRGLRFGVRAGYSFAEFDDIRGDLTNQDGQKHESRLSMNMIETGYVIGHHPVDQPFNESVKPAKVDLNGFNVTLGIYYDLPRVIF